MGNGMSAVDFDPATHTYTSEGRRVPSVTQCIDRLNDYSMVPADLLERKRELGTAVHQATALYDQDDLDWGSVADEVYPYLEAGSSFEMTPGSRPLISSCESSRRNTSVLALSTTLGRRPIYPASSLAKSSSWTKRRLPK